MIIELVGVATGLLCVVLLGRQNIATWPLGLAYALVSLVVFYQNGVFGQVLLHVVFVGLNAWGWYAWMTQAKQHTEHVRRLDLTLAGVLLGVFVVALAAVEYGINRPFGGVGGWLDSVVAAGSLIAIWMQSKRYLDVWVLWFLLNLGSLVLYARIGLYWYVGLYLIYQVLAVWGFAQWRRDLMERSEPSSPLA